MPDWKEAVRACLASAEFDPLTESDVVAELAQHLDEFYQDLKSSGLAEDVCVGLTLAELQQGDLLTTAVRSFKARRPAAAPVGVPPRTGGFLHGVVHDLRVALRNLRTKPLFSALVIGLLAIGIAGNAIIFSVFDGLFLRSLPFVESDQLVNLDETAPKWNLEYVGVSNFDLFQWRKANSTFEAMAFYRDADFNLADGKSAQRIEGVQVTREMLAVLRLQPLLGRNFSVEEDRPGGAKAVLLSYPFWVRNFQADPNVIGRALRMDQTPYTIIGVLPREAIFPDRAALWVPLAADPNVPAGYYVTGVARLKPGMSIEQAQADLLRIHKAMVPEHRVNEITSPVVMPLRDRFVGTFRTAGLVLLGAAGLVLLIVCVNIAALIMVRSVFRAREMAIRTALGATRGRIVAQLLAENLVLAVIGGTAGVALGEACLRAVVPLLSSRIPEWVQFSLDARFVAFCVAITGAAVLLFGLAPSVQAARVNIRGALADTAARTTPSRVQRATLSALVVSEVGLALTLSISAGLLLQAFRKVVQVDPGFRPENVLTFRVGMPETSYGKPEQRIAYFQALLTRLRTLPGVKAAAITSAPPLGGHWGGVYEAEGISPGREEENPTVLQIAVSPGYFEAIGMTLLAGRTFDERDGQADVSMAAIVNESFAKHFWGADNPIGKRIRRPGRVGSGPLFNSWYEVVGLLRDEKHDGLDQKTTPTVFLPYTKAVLAADKNDARSLDEMDVVLRGSMEPKMLVEPARAIVRELDPEAPMYQAQTMTEQIDQSLWVRRAYSWLFGGFAILSILLSAAGVYGIVSYAVSQRTQEIGIRMAVGARPARVLLEVLRGGMALVSMGVGAGLMGALGATTLLRTLLFGVSSHDPLIYGAVVAAIIIVGILANFVPAWRAANIDPMRALHFQ